MSLLSLAEQYIPELQKKTSREWAGPCPACGGEDRFTVTIKGDGEVFYCRGCEKSGDELAFLRLVGRSCPEAHAELGRRCESTTCPAERCRARRGGGPRPPRPVQPLQAPRRDETRPFTPAEPTSPADRWRTKAGALVEHAHQALLDCPEQLAYLVGRGLPREAVEAYRLGWLAEDRYRPRRSWGLPEERRDDGRPKRLWLPRGIVIPGFGPDGAVQRLRIRRDRIRPGQARYYWVPGSGNDVVVLGPGSRAFVVVEADLDALLVHWWVGDLVGAIPMGNSTAKPKPYSADILSRALAILVALDFEPRVNPTTGRPENPGGQAARWWLQHYPRARRWPVPAGKDPGEYFEKHGGDVRAWVLAGLPPAFHLRGAANAIRSEGYGSAADPFEEEAPGTAPATPAPEATGGTAAAAADGPEYVVGISKGGIPYLVAEDPQVLAEARKLHPDAVPFLRSELKHLQGYSKDELHQVLVAKQVFPEGRVVRGERLDGGPDA